MPSTTRWNHCIFCQHYTGISKVVFFCQHAHISYKRMLCETYIYSKRASICCANWIALSVRAYITWQSFFENKWSAGTNNPDFVQPLMLFRYSSICYWSYNNSNNNVIYIGPFTMCTRRLEESRKKVRFKFVFQSVLLPLFHRWGPAAEKAQSPTFIGTRDLKCSGQIWVETVFSLHEMDNELEKNPLLNWKPMKGP